MTSGAHLASSWRTRWHRLDVLVGFVTLVVTTGAAALYVADPQGAGRVARVALTVVAAGGLALGPLLRRSLPWRAWLVGMLGGLSFVATLVAPRSVRLPGGVPLADGFSYLAYVWFSVWFVHLAYHVGRGAAARALLDTAAAAIGCFIAIWTVSDAYRHGSVAGSIRYTIFPILDVVLLVLAAHLATLLRRLPPAGWWLAAALVTQLVLDVAWAAHNVTSVGPMPPVITGSYLYSVALLFLAATHPSVAEFASVTSRPVDRPPGHRTLMFIGLAIFSAAFSLVFPVHSVRDGVIRSVLVVALLVVLFARFRLTLRDLTHATAESTHRASHDGLTGLPNRATLITQMADQLRSNAARGVHTAVLFLDCDDFKHVNDSWGHNAGDALLRQIATNLPRHLGPGQVLARHGGDEFVVVADVADTAEAGELAGRVQRLLSDPRAAVTDQAHQLTFSIGIAVAQPGELLEPVDLIGRADVALYEAKRQGRNRHVVFDDVLKRRALTRARIGDALHAAIRDDAFTLELQAIRSCPDYTRTVGWESLARWEHPELGVVTPDEFVPVAEERGLIYDLGAAVLRRACHDLAALHRARPEADYSITVNVSAPQLKHPDFSSVVLDALGRAEVDGSRLWLEITETLLVDKGADVLDTLAEVRRAGVRLCIDDFGTGYASLATLMRLPIDCVKIDRSLVSRLDTHPDSPEQMRRLLDLLASMNITTVIAEGVETPEQEAHLLSMGCPMTQGWLYGRPMGVTDILAGGG